MVKSLDQISKNLAQVETATTEIDETLKSVYQNYLGVLGQAVKQRLARHPRTFEPWTAP